MKSVSRQKARSFIKTGILQWVIAICLDESSFTILSTVHVWHPPRKQYSPDLYNEGVQWLCKAVGNVLQVHYGSTCPLRGNYPCKSIQSMVLDPLYPTMKHVYTNGIVFFQDDPSPFHKARGLTEWSLEYEMISATYGMAVSVTRSHTSGRFWSDVLDHTFHHHHQNTNRS